MDNASKQRGTRNASGFTMLEVLVSLLVLSFGLLGVAAMQIKALQSTHVSYHRSLASIAAQDMEERLWLEMANSPASCPALSASDLEDWQSAWVDNLPGLMISPSPVSLESTANGCDYRITVQWVDERFVVADGLGGGKEEVSTFVYLTRLPGGI